MARSFDLRSESPQDELSSFIETEVKRVLARYDDAISAHISISPGMVTGDNAGINLAAPTSRQAIHDDLADLASEFVHALAVEAGRRLDDGVAGCKLASPATQFASAYGSATQKKRDRKSDLESGSIEDWAGQVAGQTYLEEHLRIPRSTLHWWQRRNDVIALRKGARKHVFPLAQFIDGRPAPGIREVLALIANSRLAWLWLIRPSPFLDGRVPIEMLRQDLVADVVLAARDFSST